MIDLYHMSRKGRITIKNRFLNHLKIRLERTRHYFGLGLSHLLRGRTIDSNLFNALEEQLLLADIGVKTTDHILSNLKTQVSDKKLDNVELLYHQLKINLSQILSQVEKNLDVSGKLPFVMLMIGVNGAGKTTTIGKLAYQFKNAGKSVMLAAGDTFRAGAIEQLQIWGSCNNIPVISHKNGADASAVIFDAMQAAKKNKIDVLIADTSGRLQNKAHLMAEIKKIIRIIKKQDATAPHEVMLTIDSSTGQNAISQTKLFHEAVCVSGITVTKLDSTAKGGVIFSLADQFDIPIRYITCGEAIEDLRVFQVKNFIEALFAREDDLL
ncbi:Signal recognition particle receptor FtsY [Candidatus Erwinia haradaeae]|uniref:Signal recognition particle receptor FtsY n=1 Tax=Candidatus Erwinia haradaeae TaxID=1922217 RepID=A0A451DC64_9GAMM|nr:Signal recognition particle receptor FtsY [Candidatus Erwinia haradaeae]